MESSRRARAWRDTAKRTDKVRRLRRALLVWGASDGRRFFWRKPGISPFAVLVVEILLAKTRAEVVAPVAAELLTRYSGPSALAAADRRALKRLLFPLGLHRKRAGQLIACAEIIVERHRGEVPTDVDQLMSLPSIGRYAANAIAVVAFGQRRSVVDANMARIYGRVFSLPPAPPRLSAADELWDFATDVLPATRSKEFTWAALDLGGTVCTARNPNCDRCPLARLCDYAAIHGRLRRPGNT